MRFRTFGLAASFTALLFFASLGESQPPPGGPGGKGDGFGKKDGKDGKGKKGKKGGKAVSADDIADHLLSFDKTNSGKVTKDQLPERMQSLVDRGDTNKDGALDKEEILALAAKLAQEGTFTGLDGKKGKGKGPGGKKGFGPGGEFGPDDFPPFDGKKGKGPGGKKGFKGDFGPDDFPPFEKGGKKGFGKGDFGPGDFGPGGGKKGPKGDFGPRGFEKDS